MHILLIGAIAGIGVNFLQIVGGLMALSFPFPFLSSPLLPSPLLPSSPLPPLSLSLEVGPPNPARGSGERCKLPQRRNRIWCILALKSVIWWQQF